MLVVLPLRLALRVALRIALRVALRCVHGFLFFSFSCAETMVGCSCGCAKEREESCCCVVALPFLLTSVCSFTYSDFQECTPPTWDSCCFVNLSDNMAQYGIGLSLQQFPPERKETL